MPYRTPVTDGSDQQEAADGGYFSSLEPARHMRLTTFKRDDVPRSVSVHGVADGDRAYFCVPSQSGTAKRLRHSATVQVTPCSLLGFLTYGPPLDSVARPLSGAKANHAAARLDRRYPPWRRFLIPPRRRQAVYYELLAADAAGGPGAPSGEPSSSLVITVQTSKRLMHARGATATSLATVCTPSASSPSCPSDYTRITTVTMSVSATRPAEA